MILLSYIYIYTLRQHHPILFQGLLIQQQKESATKGIRMNVNRADDLIHILTQWAVKIDIIIYVHIVSKVSPLLTYRMIQ